jgi:hypothetical protein
MSHENVEAIRRCQGAQESEFGQSQSGSSVPGLDLEAAFLQERADGPG